MIPIRIWDDQQDIVDILYKTIENKIKFEEIDMEILQATTDSHKLLQSIPLNVDNSGIYFLDIQDSSDSKMGFKLAQKIRELDPLAKLIFVTTHEEWLPITFERKLEAYDFIVKDSNLDKMVKNIQVTLLAAFNSIKDRSKVDEEILSFHIGSRFLQVPMHEVFYLESLGNHHLCVATKNKWFEIVGDLKQFSDKYPELLYTSKGELVNIKNASSFDRKKREIFFDGNEISLDVSYRRLKAVQDFFEQK